MDWKQDKQKRNRNAAVASEEAARNIDLLQKMDKEFEKIFGSPHTGVIAPGGVKAGDPVRRSEIAGRMGGQKR